MQSNLRLLEQWFPEEHGLRATLALILTNSQADTRRPNKERIFRFSLNSISKLKISKLDIEGGWVN